MESPLKPTLPYQYSLKERSRIPVINQEMSLNPEKIILNSDLAPGLQTFETSNPGYEAADVQERSGSKIIQENCNYDGFVHANNIPALSEKQVSFFSSTNVSPKILRAQLSVDNDNSHNQGSPILQHVGKTEQSQPPLPEKKRISESERSFGSISPSSSGFSSPHSGSTISIPFPNFLPDFSRTLTDSSLSGKIIF